MQNKNIILFIIFSTLFFGCSDAEEKSIFINVSLTECITYKNDFQNYFETNMTPLFLSSTIEISRVIDINMINELLRYSEIFLFCDLKIIDKQVSENDVSKSDDSYFVMSNSLSLIATYMEIIDPQQSPDERVVDGLVKPMRINYEKIKNKLNN